MTGVFIFLVALVPVLTLGALLTDLLLAGAPRRGKRPDVACCAADSTNMAATHASVPPRPKRERWWLVWCGLFLGHFSLMACAQEFLGLTRSASAPFAPTWLNSACIAALITGLFWHGRGEVTKKAGAPPRTGAGMKSAPRRPRHAAFCFLVSNGVLAFGSLTRSLLDRPSWPWLAFYALAVPTSLLVGAKLIERASLRPVEDAPAPGEPQTSASTSSRPTVEELF